MFAKGFIFVETRVIELHFATDSMGRVVVFTSLLLKAEKSYSDTCLTKGRLARNSHSRSF